MAMENDNQVKPKGFTSIGSPILIVFLLALWCVFNTSTAPVLLLIGLALGLAIARLFTGEPQSWTGRLWSTLKITPSAVWHYLAYFGIFIMELVRANLNMLRYVYARKIDIHPGIVKVDTRLISPMGRLALANSIALTPGSLVLGLEGSTLYIHWLDVKTTDRAEATRQIVGPFEKHLERAFG